MKRGIEESNDSDNNMNQTQVTYQIQPLQAQQQTNNQQSTSPVANSSFSSSSSTSSSSSYSPLQMGSIYTNGTPTNPTQSIMLTLPTTTSQSTQQVNSNNSTISSSSTSNSSTTSSNSTNSSSNTTISSQNIGLDGSTTSLSCSVPPTSSSIYTYTSSQITNRPEAKKVKTQKTQPSKVVHIRNIPPQITEIEIIQFGLIFGNIINVLNLRSKCQAFLEFEKCEEAQSMTNYFAQNPISVAGRQIFVQYSNYKNLVTDPSNTNNQVAKAALDLAKELHKAAQTGGQNTVLRAMIQNMLYAVTLDTIYQIFNRYGPVLKIITFTKNDKFQALIQMKDAASAQAAKTGLHGQNIYNGCCSLHIDYSKLNTLNVKYNNEKSRDYTNPLLPAGDMPEHLALGPGGVINSQIQLAMAAAAGYGAPFTTTLPAAAGYHLAPTTTPFIQFTTGKYLPQQTLISASSLLQPTTNAGLAQANGHMQQSSQQAQASNTQQLLIQQQQQTAQQVQQQAQQSNQQNVTQPFAIQQQQTQTGNSALVPTNAANLNTPLASVSHHPHHPHPHHHHLASATGAPMLIPFLQNLNEDGYIMMYTAT